MTTETNSPAPETAAPAAPARKSRRKWPWIVGGLAALSVAGAVTAQTFERPGFFHHGMGGMMGGGRGGMMQGGMDPARMADFADRGVRHMAVEVDATPEQQEKLRGIVGDLVKDIAPMRGQHQQAAERARSLLTAPTFDRAELEKLRAEQVSKLDDASKRVTKAIGDAAEVLTPEQRRKLDERMPHPGQWPFWRSG